MQQDPRSPLSVVKVMLGLLVGIGLLLLVAHFVNIPAAIQVLV